MAGSTVRRLVHLLAGLLTIRLTAGVTKPFCQDTLGMQKNPVLSTDFVFHDAWGPKLIHTQDGDNYDPSKIDWSSVIEACRVIIKHENRIANWAIRASFHDAGSNTITQAVGTGSTVDQTIITAGGADASLFLTNETLRAENAQHSFSTFVAATLRTLVGFYDISYADGIAVLAAVAVEVTSQGKYSVHSFMPAVDKFNPHTPVVDFIAGKLDSNVEDPFGILPSPLLDTQGFIDYFKPRFNQGVKDGVCLLGSHTLLSTTGCVKSDNPAFSPPRQKMFAWEADHSYFPSLLEAKASLMVVAPFPAAVGPLMQPPLAINQTQIDVCKFSSNAFQYEAARSENRTPAIPGVGNLFDVLPTWDWLNATSPNASNYHEVRRTCDSSQNCFEGWPYTMNDGFLGQTATNDSATDDFLMIRQAVKTMAHNPDVWNACYGNAYNRMVSQGATYSPKTAAAPTVGQNLTGVGKGLPITGWECPSGWVSGDGKSTPANTRCQRTCQHKCPELYMKAPLYCRCASAPWGSVAYNKLYPSAVIQSSAGNLVDGLVDQLALGDPSGPFTGGVVADTVKHAFADEALLTDAQLYPGLDESAADMPKPHEHGGHHVHCKGDEGGCEGRQWSVEVEEIFPDHPEDDVDVKVSKFHQHKEGSRNDGPAQHAPPVQDGQAYMGHTYVPGKVPASLAQNDYSQSFTDYQQPNVGYELDYDDLAAKGYKARPLVTAS